MPFGRRRGARPPEAPDSVSAARGSALRLLARRDFARAELARKLLDQGYSAGAVEAAIAELAEERLLDDARLVESAVRAHAARGHGPMRIRQELAAAGIASDLIEPALANGPDFVAICRELRARRFGSEPPSSWAERGRQARFLQYRGFSSDHIRLAMGHDPDTDA